LVGTDWLVLIGVLGIFAAGYIYGLSVPYLGFYIFLHVNSFLKVSRPCLTNFIFSARLYLAELNIKKLI